MIDKIGRAALFAKNHFKTAVNSAKELKGNIAPIDRDIENLFMKVLLNIFSNKFSFPRNRNFIIPIRIR